MTHWVGDAWEELSRIPDISVRSFKQMGQSTLKQIWKDWRIANVEKVQNDFGDDAGDPFEDLSLD